MIHSYEVRWFFREEPVPRAWLIDEPPSDTPRTDWYAWPCSDASGVKIREGRLETKLRHGAPQLWQADTPDGTQVFGRMEWWTKWSAELPDTQPPSDELLSSAGWVAVTKDRALRKYTLEGDRVVPISGEADSGVQVEWTHLRTPHRQWWTVGLEAFGPLEQQPQLLQRVLQQICEQTTLPPIFAAENSRGYPAWLNSGGSA